VNRVDNAAARAVIANNFADSWLVGLGAGFKWQWLRADLTADYGFRDKFQGTTASMADDFTANFDTFSALANVYGDLGTWFGFTPYVGAGVGMAHLSAADFIQHFQAAVAPADTGSKWNLAWALMAGVSYDISNKYAIDVGYRHINMGNVATGTDAYGNSLTFHNLAADEIRVGFRYMID
jgi:opacity protein-like surface antigen